MIREHVHNSVRIAQRREDLGGFSVADRERSAALTKVRIHPFQRFVDEGDTPIIPVMKIVENLGIEDEERQDIIRGLQGAEQPVVVVKSQVATEPEDRLRSGGG